jgi:hypothetical protein
MQVLFAPIYNQNRETNKKKEARVDFPLDALFHYYFVLYTFKGFRDEERMLNTVILLEL